MTRSSTEIRTSDELPNRHHQRPPARALARELLLFTSELPARSSRLFSTCS